MRGSGDEPDVAAQETATTTTTATSGVTAAPTTTEATTEAPTSEPTPAETTTEPAPEVPPTLEAVAFEQGESYYFTTPDGAFACGIVQLPGRTEAGCEGVTDRCRRSPRVA